MKIKTSHLLFLILFVMLFYAYVYSASSGCVVAITAKVISVKERWEDVPQATGEFERVELLDMQIEIKKINSVVKDTYDQAVNCEKVYKIGKKIKITVEKTPTFLMYSNDSIVPGSIITGNLNSADDENSSSYSLTNIRLGS